MPMRSQVWSELRVKNFENLLVNRVRSRKDAVKVYRYLTTVADQYLDVAIDFFGHVVADESVSHAVMERKPFLDAYGDSPAADCVRVLADRSNQATRSSTTERKYATLLAQNVSTGKRLIYEAGD